MVSSTEFEVGVREKWRAFSRPFWGLMGLLLVLSAAGGTALATAPVCDGVLVHRGDTLSSIARAAGVSLDQLAYDNNIVDRNLIYVGQCLVLTNTGGVLGDTPVGLATADRLLSTEYTPATHDAGGEQPGARALANTMVLLYPGGGFDVDATYGVGIYNPRKARGSNKWSTHAEGRAVDYYTPGCGDEWEAVFDFMVAKADQLGLQRILWCDRAWSSNKGGFDPSERLEHMHDGTSAPAHLHIELSLDGAQNLTEWQAFAVLSGVSTELPEPLVIR